MGRTSIGRYPTLNSHRLDLRKDDMPTKAWNELRISPTKLGALCAPSFCPLCYWRLLRLKFKKPYSFPMPAILNFLDIQEKQVATVSIDKNGCLPEYFGVFQDAVEILPIPAVAGFHQETKLNLYGKPDLVLRDGSGKVMVIDNKTAKTKLASHPLSEMYRAQVNMYGFLLERCPDAYEISRVGLLYYEFSPLTDDEILLNVGDDFMFARFTPQLIEIEYSPEEIVVPLLKKVRELIDMQDPPKGNDGCSDCALLDLFHDVAKVTDGVALPRPNDLEDSRRYSSESFLRKFGIDEARQSRLDGIFREAQPFGVLDRWLRDEEAIGN